MEVTRQNFKETLPLISQAIEDASFLAIDAEFTGLTSRLRRAENSLDTCEERYEKLKEGIKDFTIPQFGLCAFIWDEEQRQYVAKPFNFYIFPKPYSRQMPDMRFVCQSSSLDFLANQGFDFNKWINHGIPFLLPHSEEKLRQLLESRRDEDKNESGTCLETPNGSKGNQDVTIPSEYVKTIEYVMKTVAEFTADPSVESLDLPPSTPFVRKLVYSSVKSAYKSGLHLESKVDKQNKKFIQIVKVSEEEKKSLENKKSERENEEFEIAVGFSKVVRLISQSGKVILGHNVLLDPLHTIRLFICPLPGHLSGFKALVKSTLPRLIDTKVMASTAPLQQHFALTHLNELYKKTNEDPFVKPDVILPEDFGVYSEGEKSHEAGFDAYMTGVSFIAMVAYLQKLRDGDVLDTQIDFEIIKPFLNKIFLFPRIEDVPYLNLSGEDLMPNRDHVFYLDHFPETWQFSDIQALFKNFGYVYVTRLNGTSAYVSVAKKERATKVLYNLDKDGAPYRIMSYKEYQDLCNDEDSAESSYYSLNKSQDTSPAENASNPEAAKISKKPSKESAPSDGEVEDGEIADSPEPLRKKPRGHEEVEDGEIPDSPEPPKKKAKGQHTWFDEPDDW